MPYINYFILETNNMAGHWDGRPDFDFNLKSMVTEIIAVSN
jgi:hypothetical protein